MPRLGKLPTALRPAMSSRLDCRPAAARVRAGSGRGASGSRLVLPSGMLLLSRARQGQPYSSRRASVGQELCAARLRDRRLDAHRSTPSGIGAGLQALRFEGLALKQRSRTALPQPPQRRRLERCRPDSHSGRRGLVGWPRHLPQAQAAGSTCVTELNQDNGESTKKNLIRSVSGKLVLIKMALREPL